MGAHARETFLHLAEQPDLDVQALWTVNDYDDVKGNEAATVADLLLDPIFLEADLLIYVFAVYHPFFDALLIGNGHAKQVVRFHNVTPPELMPEKHRAVVGRSFVQIQNFRHADEIWCESRENLEELERQSQAGRARIVDPSVDILTRAKLADKPVGRIEMMYVGRFFGSKGIVDLVDAAATLRDRGETDFRLSLFGNPRFSDEDYVGEVRQRIVDRSLDDLVDLVGTVSPGDLADAYGRSHIFATGSRHEGFCVPVIEALAAGCIPVSYANSNLRFVADGLGRLAHTQTPDGLADALEAVFRGLRCGTEDPGLSLDRGHISPTEFDDAVTEYIPLFEPDRYAERLVSRVRTILQQD